VLLARSPLDRPVPSGETLVVGDPAFDPTAHPALRRLPGAAVEAGYVARLRETRALVGGDATESALRPLLGAPVLLHFAAHGRLDDIAPNTSSIVLADRDELSVSDLVGVQIAADLAVLSACDSGRGTTTLGGDLVGLTRGLFAAGVRRCVVSLWPVDDVAACVTMGAFHGLVKKSVAPARALALAQREIRALSSAEIAERYRAMGGSGVETPGARRGARGGKGLMAPFPEVDDEDVETTAEPCGGDQARIWAPFVLIGP
jgi:CHAT domain-containing protein